MRNKQKEKLKQSANRLFEKKMDECWGKDRSMYDFMFLLKECFIEMIDSL